VNYVVTCLNATVETQTGDVKRVPLVSPEDIQDDTIDYLSNVTIEILST
jgi:hypothetical protein